MNMFLDLPATVRRSIYEESDVVTGYNIHLTPRDPGADAWSTCDYPRARPDKPRHGTLDLLLVCKAIYDEVLSLVLSENALIIGPEIESITYGLQFIRDLSLRHCSQITNLHVILQRFRTESEYESRNKSRYPVKSHLGKDVVPAWEQAVHRLLTLVERPRLRLRLICDKSIPPYVAEIDSDDGSTMSSILRPFSRYPGKLADLQLRLAADQDHALSILALKIAGLATGRMSSRMRQGKFRFFDLPFEVRRHILEYTDLVTPYKQVQWDPKNGYSVSHLSGHLSGSAKRCIGHPYEHDTSEPVYYCTYGIVRWHRCCEFRLCKRNDCCEAKHSAYNAKCQYWTAPDYLMRVNRAMYNEAQAVLFSQNRVSVCPSLRSIYEKAPAPHKLPLRLDGSKFITMHSGTAALNNMSHLELAFWPFEEPRYYKMREETRLDWTFAVQHLATHANLEGLTLSIFLSRKSPSISYCHSPEAYEKSFPITMRAYDLWLLAAYERFLEPLVSLRGMKRFFVHLEAIWVHDGQKSDTSGRILEAESRLEKFVMGQEYDSAALGKHTEAVSHWRDDFIHSTDPYYGEGRSSPSSD